MDSLEKFISLTDQLTSQEDFLPPVIAVMGSFNTGKSTLVNSLLNEQISPEDSLPKTSSFFYVKYGEKFTARAEEKGKNICFPTREQLHLFLNNKTTSKLERIEIALNNPLLKKCTFVDTPGIDGAGANIKKLQKIAVSADKIIYLFHQRGIDEFNKNFLTKLAKTKKLGDRSVTFLINCNHGKSDGTSLTNTRLALKKIFGRTPELYLFNTRAQDSITALRRYILVLISKDFVRELSADHKKIDEKIPAGLQKSMLIQDDLIFLDHFWHIKENAEKIIIARNVLNNLPQVEAKIKHLLLENQNKQLLQAVPRYKSKENHASTVNFLVIKKQMYKLAEKMMHDQRINKVLPPRELGKWAGSLKKEQFKVVAVGGFSSGKSTFFNAVMGETLLPTANCPTTASITYIEHGTQRKAAITFKTSLNLKLCSYEGSSVKINPEELLAVEEWLSQGSKLRRITEIRIDTGRGFVPVTKTKLLQEAQRTRKLFASGFRGGKLDQRAPGTLFRPIPVWKAKTMNPVWEINLTFAPVPPVELDLETPDGRERYISLTTAPDALRIKDIRIKHPGRFFELATFVDTPGLDSTKQYHTALTTDFLQHSDAYLFFLNGKHILNQSDSYNLLEIFKLRLKDYLHAEKKQKQAFELSKFFFIINFADTLTHYEKEKVRSYLHKNLTLYLKEYGIHVPRLQIFLISPLKALQGKDTENFNKLLKAIQLGIWNYRGKDHLNNHLRDLRSRIETHIRPDTAKKDTKKKNQLILTKFSAYSILNQGVNEMKSEIHSRFAAAFAQIDQFKQAKQFKTFAWGTHPNHGQVVTPIREFSFFRWINALNRKTRQQTASIQKKVYRSVDTWLHRCGIKTNPYNLTPDFNGITASEVMEQIEGAISQSRNFYGGFKAREARYKLTLILKELERKVNLQLDCWQKQMNKYLKDLITPGIMSAVGNYNKTLTVQQNTEKHKPEKETRILSSYLSEIKDLEKILNSPGGT